MAGNLESHMLKGIMFAEFHKVRNISENVP